MADQLARQSSQRSNPGRLTRMHRTFWGRRQPLTQSQLACRADVENTGNDNLLPRRYLQLAAHPETGPNRPHNAPG